jgi:hypothetical protein
MKQAQFRDPGQPRRRGGRQHGVVLVFVLIALVIMLVASVALVRSFNTSLFNAGNLAFKRDLTNQGERAMLQVRTLLSDGGKLGTVQARKASMPALNYSAKILQTNAQGIPIALLSKEDEVFAGVGSSANDIKIDDQQVKVRYVLDRLCDSEGLEADLGAAHCAVGDGVNEAGSASDLGYGGNSSNNASSASLPIIYRLSIRVDGPRGTQAYFQATLTP